MLNQHDVPMWTTHTLSVVLLCTAGEPGGAALPCPALPCPPLLTQLRCSQAIKHFLYPHA